MTTMLLKSSLTFITDIDIKNYLTQQEDLLNSRLQQVSIFKKDVMELYDLNVITEEQLDKYLEKFFQSFKKGWDTQITIYLVQIRRNGYMKYLEPEFTEDSVTEYILNKYINSGDHLIISLSLEYCLTIINKLICEKYFKENITEELIMNVMHPRNLGRLWEFED